jgi:hypothetical protein
MEEGVEKVDKKELVGWLTHPFGGGVKRVV